MKPVLQEAEDRGRGRSIEPVRAEIETDDLEAQLQSYAWLDPGPAHPCPSSSRPHRAHPHRRRLRGRCQSRRLHAIRLANAPRATSARPRRPTQRRRLRHERACRDHRRRARPQAPRGSVSLSPASPLCPGRLSVVAKRSRSPTSLPLTSSLLGPSASYGPSSWLTSSPLTYSLQRCRCGGRLRIVSVVIDPDDIPSVFHGARAPPTPPPPGHSSSHSSIDREFSTSRFAAAFVCT